jgi:hypothetical protein
LQSAARETATVASYSQSVLATIVDEQAAQAAGPDTRPWTAVFIVASPRAYTGKTFIARLIADFLHRDGGKVQAFELSPGDVALGDQLPELTASSDLDSTQAQMRLFDRLILRDGVAKVVDVGHASFRRFFGLMEEIGFADEAQRRGMEVIVLYMADAHPTSVKAYEILQRRLPALILVPVFNDGLVKGRKLRELYPFNRAAAVPLQIPLLPPGLKAYVDRWGQSFAEFLKPTPVPIGPEFELRSWTKRAFLELREFELRVLMEKLQACLKL